MSSFTSAKLDKSATIKACNQLSMICEVILTRLSRADIEKYIRNNKVVTNVTSKCVSGQIGGNRNDNIQVKRRGRGRPRKFNQVERQPIRKSERQPIKKHETFEDKISSNTNSGPVVEFVDCSLNVEKLNTSTGMTFKLQMQEFVGDKMCNVPEGILLNKNSENRYGNADGKKKRKSVKFMEEDETCKRIRLEESSMSYNNNTTKTNSSTLSFHEDRNESSLYCNKGRKKVLFDKDTVDEIHDSCRQMIIEKSSENVYKRAEIISQSLGMYQQAHSMKPMQSIKTSKPKDQLFDPTFPLPIKSENSDETISYDRSNNKLVPIDELDTASPGSHNIPDGKDIKYEQEGQLEFSQVGHENFAEICVGISDGSICNENLNKPFTFDAALLTSSDSPHETCSNMAVLDTYPFNEVLPNVETIITPRVCIGDIDNQEVSTDNDFTPVISAVGTVHTLERHHGSFDSQSISMKSEMEISNQRDEEFITGRRNTVTDVGTNGYIVKARINLPPKSEGNKKLESSMVDDCITIDDDNDEIIDLTDSEEIINCDDDEEILPENCNSNKNEENLLIYVDSDENSRLSLNSNTSEELMDLPTENGNVVVFDGLSMEESTAKTCVKENRLSSISDLATTHNVIVGNVTTNQENREDPINRDEVIIFDDVNTVDLNSIVDFTSTVENCAPDSLLAQLLNRSDNTYDKPINPTAVAYNQSLGNKKFHLSDRTTISNMPVGKTSGDEEHSSEDKRVGKIRVKDLSNLSSAQHGNSSKEEGVEEKPVTQSTKFENSDLLISMRKVIWSQSGFTDEEKDILRTYKKYFFANTEEIIKQMGHIIHLAVCDNLNYIKYSEQVKKLLTGDTISIEKLKAEKLHNSDIVSHGTNFVKCLKEFVSRVNIRDLQDMVFIMVCRALDSFLRIDPNNKKYYRMARDVLREMLAKVNCDKYYRLDRIVYMDTYQFLKKYNDTIKLISRYCEFISNLRSQFNAKLSESSTVSNIQVKQSTLDSFVNLKNIVLQEQPVVTYNTSKLLSPSPDQSSNVLVEKSKQPLVKGVLLLNGENMTKVSNLSIDELLQMNKQVYINLKQKFFLQCYKKYFLGTTDDKLIKLGELLHVVTCEMLCQNRKLESISSLPHSALKICEEGKILTTYENNLKNRGSDFIQLMKGITGKFNGHSFSRMVCAMYCRITEIFLKIDINNIKYFVIIRDVVKKMLELNEFYNKDLFELLTMKEEDFVRSYNSVIHILLVYYELMKTAESQNAGDNTGNSSRSEQSTVSHKTSEGNIVIPLTSRSVEVPIVKRFSENSILIV